MIEANGSAFPRLDQDYKENGLTIRQYFAAMAMQGLLSNSDATDVIGNIHESKKMRPEEIVVLISVQHADALIAELNK